MKNSNNKNIKKTESKNKKGFSFVEVLVSVFLLSVGLIAVISLFSAQVLKMMNNRDYAIAAFLAQEGTELAVNIRDTNWANDQKAFDYNNTLPAASANNCIVSYNSVSISCGGSSDNNLYLNSGKYYSHNSSGTKTKFRRKIEITYDTGSASSASSMKVISVVIWEGENFPSESNLENKCNFANECAYTQTTLTDW
jgi:Tfp pilus assembly protein PilV